MSVINWIIVDGDNADQLMKKYFINDDKFDFDSIVSLLDTKEEYKYPNGTIINSYKDFMFFTEWIAPMQIFKKLSEKEPSLVFNIKYAVETYDPDQCGSITLSDGKVIGYQVFYGNSNSIKEFADNLFALGK